MWLDPMPEEEELNAFLLEEQVIMNQQTDEVRQQQQTVMNTIASTNTRTEDIISWLDSDENVSAADAQEIPLLENLCSNLQMDLHHQAEEEGEGLLVFHNNNQEDQTLFMDVFDHHPQPDHNHFQVPESPFILDLLCSIKEFDRLHPSSSSYSSPPLVDQNPSFDDLGMSEFTFITDAGNNHDPSTTLEHINEDHSKLHETVTDKVINDAENDDDEHKKISVGVHADNPKPMICTSSTSTASPLALASASASGVVPCKNLVSERNRRKRLSQQLLALRSLVPNITKMDKRSVLVDALAYLRSLHEETTRLQNELKQQPSPQSDIVISSTSAATVTGFPHNFSAGTLSIPRMLPRTKPRAIITEIETEKIKNQRFVVKITCKMKGGKNRNGNSVGGDVLRVMESLGFDITYSTTTTSLFYQTTCKPQNQQLLQTTLFIRIKNNKHGKKMTEEKLRECISNKALGCGFTFQKTITTTTTVS